MFIKLTRTDGRPIWINPEFVVTVEDRKGGGAIVVPAGDGLDYDVKESPDAVMRMCGGGMPMSATEQPAAGPAEQPPAEPQPPAEQEQPAPYLDHLPEALLQFLKTGLLAHIPVVRNGQRIHIHLLIHFRELRALLLHDAVPHLMNEIVPVEIKVEEILNILRPEEPLISLLLLFVSRLELSRHNDVLHILLFP